jgi:signal transduction histidine kinase
MYRGQDRRRATCAPSRDRTQGWLAMAAVVVAVSAVAALTDEHSLSGPEGPLDDRLLLVAGALVASGAAFLVLRWRLMHHNTSLWGAAALVGTTLTMVASDTSVFGFGVGLDRHALPVVVIATMVVAWRVTRVPEIDTGARAWHVLVGLAAALVAGTAALHAVGLGMPEEGVAATVFASLATVGWSVVAGLWIREGRRRRDWGLAWGSVLFMSLAGWQAAAVGEASPGRPVGVAGAVLLAFGALAALRGGIESLRDAVEAQGRELQATRERVNEEQSQAGRVRAAAEERAHEARNALHAVGAAIQTLERYHERLDDETKRTLSAGVTSELARLQRLIDLDEHPEPAGAFLLHEVLQPVVTAAVGGGLRVDVGIPDDLVVVGQAHATSGIVQNLLLNAQRHAGGRGVSIRAHSDGVRTVVLVCDSGPGVPPAHREVIFERSHCSEETGGSGFGLYVSRQLARAQGGDLWVTDRPGGGAVFGFDLASVDRDVVSAGVGDQSDELSEVGGR